MKDTTKKAQGTASAILHTTINSKKLYNAHIKIGGVSIVVINAKAISTFTRSLKKLPPSTQFIEVLADTTERTTINGDQMYRNRRHIFYVENGEMKKK